MGVAVAMRGGGLIAPAIVEAESLGMDQLMERLRDLVARVRGGRLRSSELSQGTVTFSNLGEETADSILPLIYPPQVAIIGCGQIAERPWADHGTVVVRRTLTVSVAGDHRVSDGRRAAQFLTHFQQLLHNPEQL
jgi:pyruvate dehydrogenase E2 component (dihydrolipoamide acetyltransferase)